VSAPPPTDRGDAPRGAGRRSRRRGACGARFLGSGAGARVLAVDIGTGTADILLTLPGEPLENAVRLVVPSRTQVVARQIEAATAAGIPVVFTGVTMGGGPCGAAMKRHVAAGLAFVAGETAARTFADDLDRVRARGVGVVSDAQAAALAAEATGRDGPAVVQSGDLDVDGLRDALRRLGVAPSFDLVCVAAQDHGFNPGGSNRAFRFSLWEQALSERRALTSLFYDLRDIPAPLTRLRAAAGLARELGGGAPVLAADTGPAALLGALPDDAQDGVLVNVGNGHVTCGVARAGRLAGVFEHHTSALDGCDLEDRLRRFLAGELTDASVRDDGGHGAVLAADALDGLRAAAAPQAGGSPAGGIMVTGPRRELLRDAALDLAFVAPHGDMMLTGCHGLLRAARERGSATLPG